MVLSASTAAAELRRTSLLGPRGGKRLVSHLDRATLNTRRVRHAGRMEPRRAALP